MPPVANVADPMPMKACPLVSAPTDTSRGSMASSVYSEGSLSANRSYSLDVQPLQQKKSRGAIKLEMSHLSLQPSSDVESEYSDLGNTYSGPPPSTNSLTMAFLQSPPISSISSPNALPDPGNQYNAHRDLDGGDTE